MYHDSISSLGIL